MKHRSVLRGFDQKVIKEFGRLCRQCEAAIAPEPHQDKPRPTGMGLGEEQPNARIVWPLYGNDKRAGTGS